MLSIENTQLILALLGQLESLHDYAKIGPNNELGKYGMRYAHFVKLCLVRPDVKSNQELNHSMVWRNIDGLDSTATFLAQKSVQETIIISLMSLNLKEMLANGAVRISDGQDIIAGMLLVAYKSNSKNARLWRDGKLTENKAQLDDYFIMAKNVTV